MAATAKNSNSTKKEDSNTAKSAEKHDTKDLRTDINEAGNWPFPIYSKQ